MITYIDHTHPRAFEGLELRKPERDLTVKCPKCQGYGGWNSGLDVYGPTEHSKMSCSQCWGWGWVKEGEDQCIHDYDSGYKSVGNCLTVWKCRSCGKEITVDSSD